MSWNSWGTRSKALPNLIREMIRSHNVNLFAVLEPRVSGNKVENHIKRMGFQSSVRINSEGYSRGLWVLWNLEVILIKALNFSTQLVYCLVKTLDGSYESLMTFIYASLGI